MQSSEPEDIPWVHCVLHPDSTQHLTLRYLSRTGTDDYRGINDARIQIAGWDNVRNEFVPAGSFTNTGDGEWVLAQLEPHTSYRLQVFLSRGDTLTAYTSMPEDIIRLFAYTPVHTQSGKEAEPLLLHDKQYGYYDSDHIRSFFSIETSFPVWVYKEGWSDKEGWFTEEELATNREDLADGFNLSGAIFTESENPDIFAAFPEVEGKPLHIRCIRFPSLSGQDTLCFSGNFKGRHSAIHESMFHDLMLFHRSERLLDSLIGIPHDVSECEWVNENHVGRMRFIVVSPEYDRYLRSVEQYRLLHEVGTDIIGVYNNANIFTNIQGGTGIFGSAIESTHQWSCGVWIY